MVNVADPYGRTLGFLDWSHYFFSQVTSVSAHEAEWTPFQTHSSENLVALRIEPGPLDL
jgi:hypothetical protein